MLRRRSVPFVLVLGALALPTAASAEQPSASSAPAQTTGRTTPTAGTDAFEPRIYPAFGRPRREIALDGRAGARLTARAARRFDDGATLTASCSSVSDDGLLDGGDEYGAPAAARPRVALDPRADVCVVSVTVVRETRRGTTRTTRPVGTVVRTASGLRALRRQQLAAVVNLTYGLVAGDLSDRAQSPARVVKLLRGVRVLKRRLLPRVMAAPDETLEPGGLGVWKAGERVVVATATPEGERLYLDYDAATREMRTNITADLFSGSSEESATTFTSRSERSPAER